MTCGLKMASMLMISEPLIELNPGLRCEESGDKTGMMVSCKQLNGQLPVIPSAG